MFLDLIITEDREFWACPVCHAQYEKDEVGSISTGLKCCPMCGDGVFKIIEMGDIKWVVQCGGCDALLDYINRTGEIRFHVEDQQD